MENPDGKRRSDSCEALPEGRRAAAYLDLWERHVAWLALNGTAAARALAVPPPDDTPGR